MVTAGGSSSKNKLNRQLAVSQNCCVHLPEKILAPLDLLVFPRLLVIDQADSVPVQSSEIKPNDGQNKIHR